MARAKRGAGGRLLELVTDNFALKAVSLALSLALFSLIHSDVDAQRSILLDVVALLPSPGSGKMLISELPTQVKVTLRGSRSRISGLSRDEFPPLQMDLRDGSSSYHYFDPAEVEVTGNVQVVEIAPATVPLVWAAAAEKQVAVEAQFEGELERGFSLSPAVEVDPPRVTLRGPAQRLARINAAATGPISLTGMTVGTHTRRVPLEPLPEYVSYLEDVVVQVRLTVEPLVSERTLKNLEVAAVGEGVLAMRPARVSVTVKGPQDLLRELDPESVVPYVEVDGDAGAATLPREVKLRGVPEGFEVVRISPASVLVRQKGGI